VRQPGRYLAAAGPADRLQELRSVPDADLPFEFFLNALRLVDGFAVADFEARTGLPWAGIASRVQMAEARGLLRSVPGGRWLPTALGRRFLNDLQAEFLPERGPSTDSGTVQALASTTEIG